MRSNMILSSQQRVVLYHNNFEGWQVWGTLRPRWRHSNHCPVHTSWHVQPREPGVVRLWAVGGSYAHEFKNQSAYLWWPSFMEWACDSARWGQDSGMGDRGREVCWDGGDHAWRLEVRSGGHGSSQICNEGMLETFEINCDLWLTKYLENVLILSFLHNLNILCS